MRISMTRTWVAAAVVLCAAPAIAQTPAPASREPFRIALTVDAASWLPEATFDNAQAAAGCAAEGVVFTSLSATDVAGKARIRYSATQGALAAGSQTPRRYGTRIAYELEFESRRANPRHLVLSARSDAAEDRPQALLGKWAAEELKRQPEYRLMCTVIAAALGDHAAMERLVPWAVLDPRGLELLADMHYVPTSPENIASIAVAKRDFSKAVSLGAAAVGPLSLFFVSAPSSPLEVRTIAGRVDPRDDEVLVQAARALGQIGDAKGTPALLVYLMDRAQDKEPNARVIQEVLDALGKVGSDLAAPVLAEWSKRPAPLGPAAERALASVRTRHTAS
jgi:hypothetical protein